MSSLESAPLPSHSLIVSFAMSCFENGEIAILLAASAHSRGVDWKLSEVMGVDGIFRDEFVAWQQSCVQIGPDVTEKPDSQASRTKTRCFGIAKTRELLEALLACKLGPCRLGEAVGTDDLSRLFNYVYDALKIGDGGCHHGAASQALDATSILM